MIKYDSLYGRGAIQLLDEKTVRKTAITGLADIVQGVEGMCKHLIRHPDPMIVPVYDFQIDKAPNGNNTVGWYEYHYDMLRLGMLNEEERSLINLIDYTDQLNVIRVEHLRKNYPALSVFMDEVLQLGRYVDIHGGNFLKDEDEAYRIIDLEGFMHFPLTNPINDWFRLG